MSEHFDATEIHAVDVGTVTRTVPTAENLRSIVNISGNGHDERLIALRDSSWLKIESHCRRLWRKRGVTVQADIGDGLRFPAVPFWMPRASAVTAAALWDEATGEYVDHAHSSLRLHPAGYVTMPESGLWRVAFSVGESTVPPAVHEAVIRMVGSQFMLHVPDGGEGHGLPSLAGLLVRSGAGELLVAYR